MASLLSIIKHSKSFLSRGIILSLCLFFYTNIQAQQNLVQNASFEEYNQCPEFANCDIAAIPHWEWSLSVAAYMNLCFFSDTAPISCASPYTVGGGGCFQYPQNGSGNSVIEVHNNFWRNQLQTKLVKPLDSAKCYSFSMYINLCDSCGYATDDIGVLFVKNFINLNGPNLVENFPAPQIYHAGEFISDKENWVHYTGTFKANGGEQYMLIGSMSPIDSVKRVELPYGRTWSQKVTYLVDNITLFECDSLSGLHENEIKEKIKLYPNPAQNELTIQLAFSYSKPLQLAIYTTTGQLIKQVQLTNLLNTIDVSALSNGLYIYYIIQNNTAIQHGKFIVNN